MILPERKSDQQIRIEALRRIWCRSVLDQPFHKIKRYQYRSTGTFDYLQTIYETNVK